jgi:hypothetical protein
VENSRPAVTGKIDLVRKEQLASQVLAVIAADWLRPAPEEVEDILERAKQQLRATLLVQQ